MDRSRVDPHYSLDAGAIWDGEYRDIPVNEAETDPLVGMSLLYG